MQAESENISEKPRTNGKWLKEDAGEQARKFLREAMSKGSDLTSTTVREHPVTATVGGLILGFLLGAAVFRPRSR